MKWTGISKMTKGNHSGNSTSDHMGNNRLPEQNLTRNLCTSIAPVQNKLSRQRTRNWGDIEQVQAHLSASLEYLAKTYKELSTEVQLWFHARCLQDCIFGNSGNPSGLEKALLSLVDHAYGIHENCWLCCEEEKDAHVSRPQTFQPSLSDRWLQYKLNALFRKLAEKSEEIALGSSTCTGNPQMLHATELPSTVLSDTKKEFECGSSSDDSGRSIISPAHNITKTKGMGLSESVECETEGSRREEQCTNNEFVQPSETVDCKKRRTSVTREKEHVARKYLVQHSGSSECAGHTGISKDDGSQNPSCKEVTEWVKKTGCENGCITASSERQELVTSKDLPLFSSSGILSDHKRELACKSLQRLAETYPELTSEVLLWLKTNCFTVFDQHYKDPASLKRDLMSIVDHAYGAHENCGDWCEYNGNTKRLKPTTFQPMLSDQSLKPRLNGLFRKLQENRTSAARRSSLVKMTRSYTNASFYTDFETKYYLNHQPLRNRLKKKGCAYLFNENPSHHVSPAKRDRLCSASENRAQTPGSNHIEKDKQPKRFIKENQEVAQCLSSEHGGGSPSDLNTRPLIVKPSMQSFIVELPMTLVFFDLETTSLAKDCEIVQLAAICGEKTFDRYILPRRGISGGASKVTGLTVSRGVMYLRRKPVNTVPLRQALLEFLSWLKGVGRCLLVGHNSKSFDAPRLLLQLEKNGLAKIFCNTVLGFLDTLPYFRKSKPHLANHRQETLAKQLLRVSYNAHRALDDVKILQRLVIQFADEEDLAKHGFSASWAYESMQYERQKQKNLDTFFVLEKKEVLSRRQCEKMAGSGLREHDLRAAHAQALSQGVKGQDGIIKLLTEKGVNGKMRTTSQKKVLDCLAAFYDEEMISGQSLYKEG